MTCAFSGLAIGVVLGLFWDAFRAARAAGRGPLNSLLGLLAVRRHGSYLVHLGVVFMALGLSASSIFKTDEKAVLSVNDVMTVGDYTLRYVDLEDRTVRNRYEVIAKLEVERNGRLSGFMKPAKAYYPGEERPMSEVSVRSGFLSDLYVAFGELSEDGTVTIEAHVNAMVKWIWIGGYFLFAGAILALKPTFRKRTLETEKHERKSN
jgi:cytochrome c-type biogenesis protein CcmF